MLYKVHFFERNGSQQRLGAARQLNGSDLTYPPLNLERAHAENATWVLGAIRGSYVHGPQFFELERGYEFGTPGTHQHVTGDLAALLLWRQEPILPVSHFGGNAKDAH